ALDGLCVRRNVLREEDLAVVQGVGGGVREEAGNVDLRTGATRVLVGLLDVGVDNAAEVHTVATTYRRLAVAENIPREADARLDVVAVVGARSGIRNVLPDGDLPDEVRVRGGIGGNVLILITSAECEGQLRMDAPVVGGVSRILARGDQGGSAYVVGRAGIGGGVVVLRHSVPLAVAGVEAEVVIGSGGVERRARSAGVTRAAQAGGSVQVVADEAIGPVEVVSAVAIVEVVDVVGDFVVIGAELERMSAVRPGNIVLQLQAALVGQGETAKEGGRATIEAGGVVAEADAEIRRPRDTTAAVRSGALARRERIDQRQFVRQGLRWELRLHIASILREERVDDGVGEDGAEAE